MACRRCSSLPACIEIIGGVLLLIGLFTRYAAFIMSGEMAVAFGWRTCARGGFFPLQNFGEAAVLFCFIFLSSSSPGRAPGASTGPGRNALAPVSPRTL